ncbi:DUF4328 domain-containing protein [Nocardia cyriacigeorgica]|uniref:DUF4328 domain-containing protein n=1 Tax=Nocardia cyriacigeorgica TaxID=135487 RepID=A0A6P1D4H0_9NOCA|nr:DUF4328 domain-containing protein [Nocardia cyriacigeorgica]NEW44351.1 DUF4328 domain-containing protein [Nocardia cyriacigeorgica]NEW49245.1 DUF4328 domain-containing protein [Nocardia cyriacigeorgica]NEW58411.1 DUF4328 domain-containing protein [Nocardia cyriacigeorgica]
MLLSPGPIDAPAERRNYRWVARRPDHRPRGPVAPGRTGPTPTPRYTQIPRWGLRDVPAPVAAAPRRPLNVLAGWLPGLLVGVALMFGIAAGAELGRYLLLMHNRTRLIDPLLLNFSDAMVNASALFAAVLALLAAIGAVGWLIEARHAAYERLGRRDPRSPRTLVLGCVIPVVNLLWPGVYLTEMVAGRDDPRALRAVRVWWAVWIFGGACAVAALFWRTADSLQAEADGVLFSAFTDAVAAAVAVATLWVVRVVEGRDLLGRAHMAHRWVVAADPAVPVIEPVQPGMVTAAARVETADGEPAAEPSGEADREHLEQEVVAK